jgi:hypothetical protein
MEIKNRFTGEVIFTHDCTSWKICVEAAIKSRADLYGANLPRANLSGANLSGANLPRANLSGANLSGANLYGANLSGANLYGANLYGANLSGAKNATLVLAKQRITPSEGAFVGWKKLQGNVIAKLVIPHDAERVNAVGSRKCRASKVFVHEMFGATEAYDKHSGKTLYKVGCEVFPDSFDPSIQEECTNGVHFFMTREEAEDY